MTSNVSDISSPDSRAISLKIIEAIKQHPVLYISEVKGNAIKLQEFRQKVWKRISDELGLDPYWVKLKWKNLRDTYCRILKYKKKSPKGARRKKWTFEHHLSFLRFPYEPNYEAQTVELTEDYINDINTEVINPQDLLEQLNDNEEDEDYSEYLEVLEEDLNFEESFTQEHHKVELVEDVPKKSHHLQQKAIDEYAKQIQSKFRKIRPKCAKLDDNVNTLTPIIINTQPIIPLQKPTTQSIQLIQTVKHLPINNSSFDYKGSTDEFFSYVAQTVKKLPPKAQADIKMDICKLISEAEIRHSEHKLLQNTQRHTGVPGMIPKMLLVPCKLIDSNRQKVND
ncbi:uncharacterized protein LOC131675777 [Phymastichus coffea]|uniref:uncharacterized protein LOC131675777 n=1 Tax=Phymastichus coffea TaxID=108790 RepID=UPI00273CF2F7|nr:uncharacterized protein LOC131675777 [Phymastichus coffea]